MGQVHTDEGDSTGTIIHYNHQSGIFIILSCAHCIVSFTKKGGTIVRNELSNITFKRIETTLKTSKVIATYPVFTWKIYPGYNGLAENDVALLFAFDKNRDYAQNMFTNGILPQDEIIIGCCKNINYKNLKQANAEYDVVYELYGYPSKSNEISNVIGDGLYGMSSNVQNQYGTFDVLQNDEKTLFEYDAIDTEPGQSGAALFYNIGYSGYGKYKSRIVGVHSAGEGEIGTRYMCNLSVALNADKASWIDKTVKNYCNILAEYIQNCMDNGGLAIKWCESALFGKSKLEMLIANDCQHSLCYHLLKDMDNPAYVKVVPLVVDKIIQRLEERTRHKARYIMKNTINFTMRMSDSLIITKIANTCINKCINELNIGGGNKSCKREVLSECDQSKMDDLLSLLMIGILGSEERLETDGKLIDENERKRICDDMENMCENITSLSQIATRLNKKTFIPQFCQQLVFSNAYGRHRRKYERIGLLAHDDQFGMSVCVRSGSESNCVKKLKQLIGNWIMSFIYCMSSIMKTHYYQLTQEEKTKLRQFTNIMCVCVEQGQIDWDIRNVQNIFSFLITIYKICWDDDEAKRVQLKNVLEAFISSRPSQFDRHDQLLIEVKHTFQSLKPRNRSLLQRDYEIMYQEIKKRVD